MWLTLACHAPSHSDHSPPPAEHSDTASETVAVFTPDLTVGPAIEGELVDLDLTGLPPDEAVSVWWTAAGPATTPDCATFAPACVDLVDPQLLGTTTADASGELHASIVLPVADELWIQAGASGFVTDVVHVVPEPPLPVATVSIDVRPGIRDLVAVTTVTSSDLTTVTLAYRWRVDGVIDPDLVGPHVPATEVFPGQEWGVEVTPTDAWHAGVPVVSTTVVPDPPGTNVIVILLDDVGAEKLDLYDPAVPAVPTPTIDALAAQGVVFDRAYSAAMCSAARANLLSGRHARRNGIGNVLKGDTEMLSLEAELLPEALHQARTALPWTSVALGKWNLSSLFNDPATPNLQGFDWFGGTLSVMSDVALLHNNYYDWWKTENGVGLGYQSTYNTIDIVDDAIAQVATLPQPFFLYLPLNAAHDPMHVPPAELFDTPLPEVPTDIDLHRAVLQAADTELGRFLAAVPADVLANTTIILTADNGTQPNAVEAPYDPDRSKRTVFEGGVHVPLIVSGPLVLQPGTRSDALVHMVDIFTTVADIAGVPLVDQLDDTVGVPVDDQLRTIDGRSLLPYLADPTLPSLRKYLFVEHFSPNGPPPYDEEDLTAIRDDEYKLMSQSGVLSLYHLDVGALDDGPDVLADGIDATEQAELDLLTALLDEKLASLVYEGF